jgi:N-acetylneuraminic acid mutarotase
MPTPRSGLAVAAVGHRVWCFGGSTGANVIEVFDTVSNKWMIPPFQMPAALVAARAVVVNRKIWLIGGASNTKETADVHIFDPATEIWVKGAPMITPRAWHAAVAF